MRMHWSFILVGLFATNSCQEDGKLLGTSSAVSPSKSPLIIEADQNTGRVSATLEAGELREASTTLLSYGFNQMSPGPTLIAPVGTTLDVQLLNSMEVPTTLHWHGAGAPNEMDGTPRVQSPVEPGGNFNYQFTLESPGTFWYHPHFDTARQVDLGLYGMLIVYDPSEPQPDERLVLVFDSAVIKAIFR